MAVRLGQAPTTVVSRRLLRVFAGVMLVVVLQLAWWMFYHIRSVGQMRDTHLAHLKAQRGWAIDMILQAAPPPAPADLLRAHFPALLWAQTPSDNAQVRKHFRQNDVVINPALVRHLQQRHDALIRMFFAEGGFFCLLTGIGAWLVLRTLQYETSLMHRQHNFLSAVTHELKSPLASLRLYADTLSLRDPPKPKREEYLENMKVDIDRLTNLVGNLLAVASLDTGSITVFEEDLDLSTVVRRCIEPVQKALASRGLVLNLQIPSEPVPVRCDPAAMCTVVRNLLDNAAKYGNGQPIDLEIAARDQVATLQVRDHGMGLSAGECERIFHKFYRVGDEMVRQTEGSGLGLYLARALLQHSQGTITATSQGSNQGATFVVTLPLGQRCAAPRRRP